MMTLARQAFTLAGIIVVILSGVGCIGVRGGELEEKREWPPAPDSGAKKPAIRLSVVGKATLNKKPVVLNPATPNAWLQLTRDTYLSSGLFSDVLAGGDAADLNADVEVLDAGSGSKFMWFMTGFTLGLIPSSGTDEFTWRTTFKDRSGVIRGVVEKRESSTMWMQLLLMFGLPFSSPGSAVKGAVVDLNRSTILDAAEKGYLKP